MAIETTLGIICLIIASVSGIGYRYCCENVYIKGKYQRKRYIHGGARRDY